MSPCPCPAIAAADSDRRRRILSECLHPAPQIEAQARELMERLTPAERLRLLAGEPGPLQRHDGGGRWRLQTAPLHGSRRLPTGSGRLAFRRRPSGRRPRCVHVLPRRDSARGQLRPTSWRSALAKRSGGRRVPMAPTSVWLPASTSCVIPVGGARRRPTVRTRPISARWGRPSCGGCRDTPWAAPSTSPATASRSRGGILT